MRIPPDGTHGVHVGQLNCGKILAWGGAHHHAWAEFQALQVNPPYVWKKALYVIKLPRLGETGEQELVDSKDDLTPNEVIWIFHTGREIS